MDTYPLIQTKLIPPRLHADHLPRPRLLRQLDQGLADGLILISAPAGYGKTSLAAEWVRKLRNEDQGRPVAVAWVSLDETDNDLYLFLRYIITSIQEACSDEQLCAGTLALLHALQPPPFDLIANTFLNEVAGLPGSLLLVLDDYHLITDRHCNEMVERLARYAPEELCLLLVTRFDPLLRRRARRRAQQTLVEVRATHLRFTPVETHAFLQQATGASISQDTADALEADIEGWIIGLQLAGLSLSNQSDQAAYVQAFRKRGRGLAMDFLLDEVLARQPRPLLDFMLQTSILNRLCDDLCVATLMPPETPTGVHRQHLTELDQRGLFLIPLDDRREWYRYHHLFQELLQQRLAREYSREAIAGLHVRAGSWLAEEGYIDEALSHLLSAGEIDAAVSLVEQNWHTVLNREDFLTLERWMRMLPEDHVAERPSLLQLRAWVLRLRFRLEAVPPLLRQAETLIAQTMDVPASNHAARFATNIPATVSAEILRGERETLWSEAYFWRGDFQRSLASARSALDHLPPTHLFARGLAALYECESLQAIGQLDSAITLLNERLADEQLQHPAFQSRMLIAAAYIYGAAGELQTMRQFGQRLLDMGRAMQRPVSAGWGNYIFGLVYYHWNQLDEAFAHLSALSELRYLVHFRAYHEAQLGVALLRQIQGDRDGALQTLDELSSVLLEMNHNQLAPEVDAFRARLALLGGDMPAAIEWATAAAGPRVLPGWWWEASVLTRVKVLVAHGTSESLEEARQLLQAALQDVDSAQQATRLIEVWALRALIEAAQGNVAAALDACRRAVELARRGNFIRIFVDLGPAMGELLRQVATTGNSVAFVGRLLAAFPAEQSALLSERELEILHLLQQGWSNKKIAARLVISLNTVKKHNRNIYQKLGVHNRRQAIDQAQVLGLL